MSSPARTRRLVAAAAAGPPVAARDRREEEGGARRGAERERGGQRERGFDWEGDQVCAAEPRDSSFCSVPQRRGLLGVGPGASKRKRNLVP